MPSAKLFALCSVWIDATLSMERNLSSYLCVCVCARHSRRSYLVAEHHPVQQRYSGYNDCFFFNFAKPRAPLMKLNLKKT